MSLFLLVNLLVILLFVVECVGIVFCFVVVVFDVVVLVCLEVWFEECLEDF